MSHSRTGRKRHQPQAKHPSFVAMEKIPDIMSRDAAPWRRWYKTARWQQLRERILLRDMYTCQKTGVLLIGKHPAPNSPVIHHDKEHRGNEVLFWDESNLVSVSKEWHDNEAQKAEQASLQQRGVWY